MTQRELFMAVVEKCADEELVAAAKLELDKLDAANAKKRDAAANKAVEKEKERAPQREALMAALTDKFQTSDELIAAAGLDITTAAVSHLLRSAVAEGRVIKGSVIVDKKSRVGYARGMN